MTRTGFQPRGHAEDARRCFRSTHSGPWSKKDTASLPHVAYERIERIDRQRLKHSVGVGERSAADHRNGRAVFRKFTERVFRCGRQQCPFFSRPLPVQIPASRCSSRRSVHRLFPRLNGFAAGSLRITCARPSASTPSVPGMTGTHSSALAPVCDIRGSTCTNFARTPGLPWRISP